LAFPHAGELKRFVAYGASGAVATASHYATLVALVSLAGMGEVAASSIGFLVGACVKYPLNYWAIFRSTALHRVAVVRFDVGLAIGFALNAALLALLLRTLPLHYLVLQVFTTGAVVVVNYVIARNWVFSAPGARTAR
jgi:putative flippase GtrA